MRATRLVLLASFLASVASCIPARDNPFDPSLQPRASLVVRAGGADTQIGGIHTVWTLDASGSRGSGGSGTPKKFEFELDTDEGGTSSTDFDYVAADGGAVLVLSSGLLRTPGVSLTREMFVGDLAGVHAHERVFKVRVTGDDGTTAVAEVPVRIENRPPTVPDVEIFVATEGAPEVILDACDGTAGEACASSDPDADDAGRLTYSWTLVSGDDSIVLEAVDPEDASNRRRSFVPVGRRGWELELTATDGIAESVPGRYLVFRSGAFYVGMTEPSRLFRVYPDFSVRETFVNLSGEQQRFDLNTARPFALPDGEGGTWLGVTSAGTSSIYRTSSTLDANATGFTRIDLPDTYFFEFDDGTSRHQAAFDGGLCLVVGDASDDHSRLLRVTESDTSFPPSLDVDLGLVTSEYRAVVLPEAEDRCLVLTDDVYRIDGDGATALTSGAFGDALSAAYENGAVWVLDRVGGFMGERYIHYVPLPAPPPAAPTVATPITLPGNEFGFPFFPDQLLEHPSGVGVLARANDGTLAHLVRTSSGTWSITNEADRGLPQIDTSGARALLASDTEDHALWYVDDATYDVRRWVFRGGVWRDAGSVGIDAISGDLASVRWGFLRIDTSTSRLLAYAANQISQDGRLAQIPPHLRRSDVVDFTLSTRQRLSVDRASGSLWYSDCDLTDPAGEYCPDGKGMRRLDVNGRISVAYDAYKHVTASHEGGAWISADAGGTVQKLDREGTPIAEASYQMAVPVKDMALGGPGGETLCIARRSAAVDSSNPFGQGAPLRIAGGVETTFGETLECVREAAAGADGSCWFVASPDGACTSPGASNGTRVVRYPGGSSVPDIDFEPNLRQSTTLLVDPRGGQGFWLADPNANTIHHYDGAAPVPGLLDTFNPDPPSTVGEMTLVQVCADSRPECLELWSAQGPVLVRGTADLEGEPLETIRLGTSGTIRNMAVVPYVFVE